MHVVPDGATATGTIRWLIQNAYGLREFQLIGGPDWVNNEPFDIQARIDPPDAYPAVLDETGRKAWSTRQMERLQSLLLDRFQLKCHIITKELPVYDLIVAKGGPKLHETTAAENKRGSIGSSSNGHTSSMKATGITMQDAARDLSGELGRTVVDKTGLNGSYDLQLTWTPEAGAGDGTQADAASGPTLFTALQEQLGLKLEAAKGPVQILVIDTIQKPGEN